MHIKGMERAQQFTPLNFWIMIAWKWDRAKTLEKKLFFFFTTKIKLFTSFFFPLLANTTCIMDGVFTFFFFELEHTINFFCFAWTTT